jgi:hypothetical protein
MQGNEDSLQLGQVDASQAEENKHQKKDKNSEAQSCTKKQKRPPPTYQNLRPMATNNFFAPLRDLPVEDAETGGEGNSTRTPGTNESTGEGRSPLILTSDANLIILRR